MPEPTVIFRVHAIQRMFARGITEVEVRSVLEDDDAIEENSDDAPFPSRLLLGWFEFHGHQTPIHVLASFDSTTNTIFVVTVYEPDPRLWELGFRRRKQL